ILVVTSERPPIQTAFNIPLESVKEIKPGHALIIKKDGKVSEEMFRQPVEQKSCSFERIYFSRGSDADIYKERKALGSLLCKQVLDSIDHDIENTVFSFIPNTAEVSYLGMMEGVNQYVRDYQKKILLNHDNKLSDVELDKILSMRPRFEKRSEDDAKLRTLSTQDADRQDMMQHVYDTTYVVVRSHQDTVVAIDVSIVRGSTLKQSKLTILDRLKPKKIVIVSSAPQIRYPDCYGIDMSRMGEFVAFEAAINLLKRNGMSHVIDEVYQKCLASIAKPKHEVEH